MRKNKLKSNRGMAAISAFLGVRGTPARLRRTPEESSVYKALAELKRQRKRNRRYLNERLKNTNYNGV